MKKFLMLLTIIGATVCCCHAGITYDALSNTIKIHDYPEDMSCTLRILYNIDKMMKWGKVKLDSSSKTYVINANLLIGSDDGSETYFQIGDEDEKTSTLIINGNIIIHPTWLIKEKRFSGNNCLKIGNKNDEDIKATVKFISPDSQRHSIQMGLTVAGKWEGGKYSGQLFIYNSTLTSAEKNQLLGYMGERYRPTMLRGRVIHIVNSRISNIAGGIDGLGRNSDTIIKKSIFENIKGPIDYWDVLGRKPIVDCVFKNNDIAFLPQGGKVVLRNCTFENNKRNFLVSNVGALILINCNISPPQNKDIYRKSNSKIALKRGWKAMLICKRSVNFSICDKNGKAIANAIIEIFDKEGKSVCTTRSEPGGKAQILLAQFSKQASDKPTEPIENKYWYKGKISANGFEDIKVDSIIPDKTGKVIKITLNKKMDK